MTFEQVMEFTRSVSAPDALQDAECKAMYDALMHVPPGGYVVEIGCQLGRSSSIIAQLQREIGYHAIHIDPYTEQPEYLKGWIDMMWKTQAEFTLMKMGSEYAWPVVLRFNPVDLVYIDGDHEYPSVIRDLNNYGKLLKRGGYLLAHDCKNPGLPGVNQALSEFIDIGWHEIGIFEGLGVWLRK